MLTVGSSRAYMRANFSSTGATQLTPTPEMENDWGVDSTGWELHVMSVMKRPTTASRMPAGSLAPAGTVDRTDLLYLFCNAAGEIPGRCMHSQKKKHSRFQYLFKFQKNTNIKKMGCPGWQGREERKPLRGGGYKPRERQAGALSDVRQWCKLVVLHDAGRQVGRPEPVPRATCLFVGWPTGNPGTSDLQRPHGVES